MQNESLWGRLHFFYVLSNAFSLFFIAFGSLTLVLVGYVVWHDITVWSKNLALIFFVSRTGERISLGIGMKVAHYFLVGFVLLFSGFVILIKRRRATRMGFFNFNTECRGRERHDATTKKRHPDLLESAKKLFEQIWNEQESISPEGVHAS